jgi:hypothetical protein
VSKLVLKMSTSLDGFEADASGDNLRDLHAADLAPAELLGPDPVDEVPDQARAVLA